MPDSPSPPAASSPPSPPLAADKLTGRGVGKAAAANSRRASSRASLSPPLPPPPPPPPSRPGAVISRRSGPTLSLATVTACGLPVSPSEEHGDPFNGAAYGSSMSIRDGTAARPASSASTSTASSQFGLAAGDAMSRIHALAQRQAARAKEKGLAQRVEDLAASARENMAGWSARAQVAGSEFGQAVGQWRRGLKKEEEEEEGEGQLSTSAFSHNTVGTSLQPMCTTEQAAQGDCSIFGAPLDVVTAVSQIDPDLAVPAVLVRCIEFLDERGLSEVGLYRVPGRWSAVMRLRGRFENGSDVNLLETDESASVVATLLKMYVRELPEPLFTDALLPEFNAHLPQVSDASAARGQNGGAIADISSVTIDELIAAANQNAACASTAGHHDAATAAADRMAEQNAVKALRAIADRLPMANRHVLHWLGCHLRRVAAQCERNKMTLSNLGLIFCPTLGISSLLFRMLVQYVDEIVPMAHDCAENTCRRGAAAERERLAIEQAAGRASSAPPADSVADMLATTSAPAAAAIAVVASVAEEDGIAKRLTVCSAVSLSDTQAAALPPPKPPRQSKAPLVSHTCLATSDAVETARSQLPRLPLRPSAIATTANAADAVSALPQSPPSPALMQPTPSQQPTTGEHNTGAAPTAVTAVTVSTAGAADLSTADHRDHTASATSVPPSQATSASVAGPPKPPRSTRGRATNRASPLGESEAVQIPLLADGVRMTAAADAVAAATAASGTAKDSSSLGLVSFEMARDGHGDGDLDSCLLNLSPRLRTRGLHGGRVARARAIFEQQH
ncbi:hypothetical protein THASP1DRAFT_30944 [Thamnocephalis sphaerospora]|uniref:Rho-GAP domain-containing protein n=1 Tax=Thamnocephalis sphaerospora TaxID=78915 RepID=A0A4P9XPP9_9FUNG|nr:hypothetical protein THASP1DRAFT_30944 [Thamnocephalis sphaerospora]|eukprot:RKP07240.1 hypothetical protein THASP1DRAFT_30944 [Thamnocephalis sphaerospora]